MARRRDDPPKKAPAQDVPELVLRAISFAAQRHATQLRKDGRTPYVSHPMRVLFLLSHVFGVEDPETLAAAVLHDTIEDTTTDRDDLTERFGPGVASIVAALSKDMRMPHDDREALYFRTLASSPAPVKLCKLADALDNLIDVQGLTPAHQARQAAKARRLLRMLEPDLPAECRRAHAIVRRRAER